MCYFQFIFQNQQDLYPSLVQFMKKTAVIMLLIMMLCYSCFHFLKPSKITTHRNQISHWQSSFRESLCLSLNCAHFIGQIKFFWVIILKVKQMLVNLLVLKYHLEVQRILCPIIMINHIIASSFLLFSSHFVYD